MNHRKLLIVHDSRVIRNLLKGYVLAELDDVQPLEAGSVEEAEELALIQKIDAVLCGLFLRDYDGYDLRAKIRSTPLNSKTPVIIFTSMTADKDINELKAQGVVHYLRAPFSSSELREMINQACDPRKARKLQRYSIPGTKVVIHFNRQEIEADVINLSLNSVFCEFRLPTLTAELLDGVYLSIRFSQEFDHTLIENVYCKMLSIRTMNWDSEDKPDKIRVVWLLQDLSRDNLDLYSRVLDIVEEKNKKLSNL